MVLCRHRQHLLLFVLVSMQPIILNVLLRVITISINSEMPTVWTLALIGKLAEKFS